MEIVLNLPVSARAGLSHYSGNLLEKQLVTKCDYGDLKILRYDFVGSACGFGVNNYGLAIWATTLPQGEKRDDDGLL